MILLKIVADLHTHTIASGHAYSTIDEVVRTASQRGLKVIGITDHGPLMPGAAHPYYFGNLKTLPDELYGVRILCGIEANILTEGKLDVEKQELEKLDFVAAGIHHDGGYEGESKEDHTIATIRAIENPLVKMITHPANLSLPVDIEKVVKAAAREDVILEINASSFDGHHYGRRGSEELSLELCQLAQEFNVPLSINSDAHFHTEVGRVDTLYPLVEKAGLKEEDIINCSLEKTLSYLN